MRTADATAGASDYWKIHSVADTYQASGPDPSSLPSALVRAAVTAASWDTRLGAAFGQQLLGDAIITEEDPILPEEAGDSPKKKPPESPGFWTVEQSPFPVITIDTPGPPADPPDDATPRDECCPKKGAFQFPFGRVGGPKVVGGIQVVWWFDVRAEFTESLEQAPADGGGDGGKDKKDEQATTCRCYCCEFRQYARLTEIRGTSLVQTPSLDEDCRIVDNKGRDTQITTAQYQSQHFRIGAKQYTRDRESERVNVPKVPPDHSFNVACAGRREGSAIRSSVYHDKERRLNKHGCFFRTSDQVSTTLPERGDYAIRIELVGRIIDVCGGGKIKEEKRIQLAYTRGGARVEKLINQAMKDHPANQLGKNIVPR